MISFPNAKINLGLYITEKRPDNFHNLESVFYPVDWQDALEIMPSDKFEFHSSGITIYGSLEDNLCVKVYNHVKKIYDLPPVKIHLHKNIPVGAGLGGGSSDAAFTLKTLNNIFKLNLSETKMEDIVRIFGSDCAFFIKNKPVYAFEKGDRFENIDLALKDKIILLIHPSIHISTKEDYERIIPKRSNISVKDLINKDISDWKEQLHNDFEISIFKTYPIIKELKEQLYQMGALYASMSGSGSAVFGIFESEKEIDKNFPAGYRIWKGKLL